MRFLGAALAVALLACSPRLTVSRTAPSAVPVPVPRSPSASSLPLPSPSPVPTAFNVDKAIEYTRQLCEVIGSRSSGSDGERAARGWLSQAFRTMGYEPAEQVFSRADGGETANIVVTNGRSGPGIVLGGHYDTVRGSPGCNDNASGTAVVLTLAEMLKSSPLPLTFIAFASEEIHPDTKKHHEGSLHYVGQADLSLASAMISIDMIGAGPSVLIVSDSSAPSKLDEEVAGVATSQNIPAIRINRGNVSDHTSFARRGVPAVLLWTGLVPSYHSPRDRMGVIEPEAVKRAGELTLAWLRGRGA